MSWRDEDLLTDAEADIETILEELEKRLNKRISRVHVDAGNLHVEIFLSETPVSA